MKEQVELVRTLTKKRRENEKELPITGSYGNGKRKEAEGDAEMSKRLLEEGDIIELVADMKVYADIPAMYIYENRRTSREISHQLVVVGKVYVNDTDISKSVGKVAEGVVERFSWEGFDLSLDVAREFVLSKVESAEKASFGLPGGKYIVYKTTFDGGGPDGGMSYNSNAYPDGHHVFCRKLDGSGSVVDFYQTGSFTALIADIEPVGSAELCWQER